MDHCPLPPGKGHIKIRNFTSTPYVTGPKGFLGYPERRGWSSDDLDSRDYTKTRSVEQVRDFFQGWLFFGCAIEFLSLCGVSVQHSDFIAEDGQYVTTKRHPQMLREWKKIAHKRRRSRRLTASTVIQAALILKAVRDFVDGYCLPRYGRQGVPADVRAQLVARSPLPQRAWMSVIALGHALDLAMKTGFGVDHGSTWGGTFMLEQRMLTKGWCSVDVQRTYTSRRMTFDEDHVLIGLISLTGPFFFHCGRNTPIIP
ncbi:hypothetical protein ACRALDRAFT_2030166 [Sodiomyces alcalophilus JCM 7366]|uniref:uncharacterized protein n=1 Tax=Sodiomyces alcalophilus JCM 7366 TaxID=591952 RepID=UPI0039B377C4